MLDTQHRRPEREQAPADIAKYGVIHQRLPLGQRLYQVGALRKTVILLALVLVWEVYARSLNNPLLFPTFSATLTAFFQGIVDGGLVQKAWTSVRVLLVGYSAGLALAALLALLAITSRVGADLLEMFASMFNPLPAIALLPLAMIWFGLGMGSIVFVIIHSVLWAVALNTHSGFMSVSNTLRMVGRNYGLRGPLFVVKILVPAAFPHILTGLKIGWAFAWRTLIGAELVFGVTAGDGGLGWFIFENKNLLQISNVFAGLFAVIAIGLFVENFIFRTIETNTVRRWGMMG